MSIDAQGGSAAPACYPALSFLFVEFNPRRKSRGAEAARVEVFEDGESCGWLWMSERDIRNNLRDFGDSAELRKALSAYRAPVSVSAYYRENGSIPELVSAG
jgi:hypothetical protein